MREPRDDHHRRDTPVRIVDARVVAPDAEREHHRGRGDIRDEQRQPGRLTRELDDDEPGDHERGDVRDRDGNE
jgi:hypothetical protein